MPLPRQTAFLRVVLAAAGGALVLVMLLLLLRPPRTMTPPAPAVGEEDEPAAGRAWWPSAAGELVPTVPLAGQPAPGAGAAAPPTNPPAAVELAAAGHIAAGTTNGFAGLYERGAARVAALLEELRTSGRRPLSPEVVALANSLTAGLTTDPQKARAIYDWLTANIRYDWKEWANVVGGADAHINAHDPASVLSRGTTICTGYSWLFNDLCRAAGLSATHVIGRVRGYRGTLDDQLVTRFGHSWNAVRINGDWQLLDATWGARQEGETAAEHLARRDYYFGTPSRQMIFDHLPEQSEWQLLETPLPAEEFQALPNLKPAFFRDGLRLGNGFSDTIATRVGEVATVTLAAPPGVGVAATLTRDGRDFSADHLVIQEAGVRRDIRATGLPAGRYILRLFSRPAGSAGRYDCSADYVLNVGP